MDQAFVIGDAMHGGFFASGYTNMVITANGSSNGVKHQLAAQRFVYVPIGRYP
jgi:hypothetical protein